jgi:hypothetical protein
LDVSALKLTRASWAIALTGIAVVGLALRLHGIHDPMLDHPGWRQGDTAAIARNFARLQFDIMYPQTMYNGPPPNYVELELQVVPFLAATLYKIFGIHEIFGRLLTLTFSVATVVTLGYFGRWLFSSALAGLAAAFFYAVFPGSVYYGRTFMPDAAMVFFLTAALFATARYLVDDERLSVRGALAPGALLTLAYLAKPVAVLALLPLGAIIARRVLARRPANAPVVAALVILPLVVLALYDRRIASYAEWHWASGITRLHVLPALVHAFGSASGFLLKAGDVRVALGALRASMLGNLSFGLAIASFAALPWISARSRTLLWCWLLGGLFYVFVVVSVERVDYYMLPLLPLCALSIGGALARYAHGVANADVAAGPRYALLALVPLVAFGALLGSRAPVAAYYRFNRQAYRDAVDLNHRLPANALVVIGHYGPDVQYYIDRFGWEEDPMLWTPFDEESAISKGARYFISIEDSRLRHNLELCAWLQRFPLLDGRALWPVYQTDPAKMLPGADRFWREYRAAARAGSGRAFLDAHGRCRLTAAAR